MVRFILKLYTQSEISNSLKNLKISKNDNIYCSSSLGMLGIPKFSAENIDDICSIFFETLLIDCTQLFFLFDLQFYELFH